jgi:hypothetical protein
MRGATLARERVGVIDRDQLDAYLARVARRFELREEHETLMRFMCRCLVCVRQYLPDVGQQALDRARNFWLDGKGAAEDLFDAQDECWKYLDAKSYGSEIRNPDDAAMRAVVCVLSAEPDSEDFPSDSARFFADMLDRLGECPDEITQLMKD